MIIRLHAMFQQSRKMLIFLVVAFVVITVPCGVMIGVRSGNFTRGKLSLMMEGFSTQAHVTSHDYQKNSCCLAPIPALAKDTTHFRRSKLGF